MRNKTRNQVARIVAASVVMLSLFASTQISAIGKSWGNSYAGVGLDFATSNWDVFGYKTGVKLEGTGSAYTMGMHADLIRGYAQVSQNALRNTQIFQYGYDVMNVRILTTGEWLTPENMTPERGFTGPWHGKSYTTYIPLGPLPPFTIKAGYSIAPKFNFRAGLEGGNMWVRAAPQGTAAVNLEGSLDMAIIKGGIGGAMTLLAGGMEVQAYFAKAAFILYMDARLFVTTLNGRIYAFAKNISGFKCSWKGCRRTWHTIWSPTLASWPGIAQYTNWYRILQTPF